MSEVASSDIWLARLAGEVDLSGFRDAARRALREGRPPRRVRFAADGRDDGDLFAHAPPPDADAAARGAEGAIRVPARFLGLVDAVGRHRDGERFDLLYAALWRMREEPGFLEIASDPLLRRLEEMASAVRRDRHKMTAFVRFREIETPYGSRFVAWFEPDHFIEEWSAPHFVDRFAAMDFAILTPRASVLWVDRRLAFGPGARAADAPSGDVFSDAWAVYYRAIFNPARLSPKAMLKEMPKKYWRNLPETRQAPALIAQARAREAAMLTAPPVAPSPRAQRVTARRVASTPAQCAPDALVALAREARDCRRCTLGVCATQTVFGEGPLKARAMFVGEQPGDREDLVGRPFVGPAGGVLDEALRRAGLDRSTLYLTNAVKHFKFDPRGKRRLHKTPSAAEIDHCRWWLERELALVETPVIVTLGASALRGVAGAPGLRDALAGETPPSLRGRVVDLGARRLVATVHPASLLRLSDAATGRLEMERFVADLALVGALAAG